MIYIVQQLVESYGKDLEEVEEEIASLEDADEIEYVDLIIDVPRGAMYHDGISLKQA